jgi:hypothetical protein
MRKIIILIALSLATLAYAGGETKKICKDVVKNGKTVQQCKTIKVHKKLEGTAVPEKSAKK